MLGMRLVIFSKDNTSTVTPLRFLYSTSAPSIVLAKSSVKQNPELVSVLCIMYTHLPKLLIANGRLGLMNINDNKRILAPL